SAHDSAVRSGRRGTRRREPSTAAITPSETRPVKSRLTCSMRWLALPTPMSSLGSQFGQSWQPRPEPDSRTAAPVTMIAPSRNRATSVRRRYARGDSSDRQSCPRRGCSCPGVTAAECTDDRPRGLHRVRKYDLPMPTRYDEFGLFAENAAEAGIPYDGPPVVSRQFVI